MNRVIFFKRVSSAIQRRLPVRTLPSTAAYTLWAKAYPPTAHNRLMQIEQAAMLSLLPTLTGCDVLDLACGSGRYALIAQQHGARHVVGLDNNVAMLQRGRLDGALAQPMQGALDAIPYRAESFDGVICGLATGHLPPDKMRAAVGEIGRVLRPGGWALISDFHPFLYFSGGRRTFSAPDGRVYAVEHYPHLMADYHAALNAAGLHLEMLLEPRAVERDMESRPAVVAFRARNAKR